MVGFAAVLEPIIVSTKRRQARAASASASATMIGCVCVHDRVRLRSRSRRALFGILLGSLGLVLLVRPGGEGLAPNHWYGVAALVVAGWCWAAGTLYSRYRPQHPSSAVAGAQQMIAGGTAMLVDDHRADCQRNASSVGADGPAPQLGPHSAAVRARPNVGRGR
jgi:hypothetical protein